MPREFKRIPKGPDSAAQQDALTKDGWTLYDTSGRYERYWRDVAEEAPSTSSSGSSSSGSSSKKK